jgi:hypothetical protein
LQQRFPTAERRWGVATATRYSTAAILAAPGMPAGSRRYGLHEFQRTRFQLLVIDVQAGWRLAVVKLEAL